MPYPGSIGQEFPALRDATHVGKDPVTLSEMQACLEPLHICLQRMESTLMQLSLASLPSAEEDKVAGGVHLAGDELCVPMQDQSPPEGPMELLSVENRSSGTAAGPFTGDCSTAWPFSGDSSTEEHLRPSLASGESIDTNGTVEMRSSETEGNMGHTRTSDFGHALHTHAKSFFSKDDSHGIAMGGFADQIFLSQTLKSMDAGGSLHHSLFDRLEIKAAALANWWHEIQEPERRGLMIRLVHSRIFETTCMLTIACNSVFVAVAADWEIRHVGMSRPKTISALEDVFLFYFVLELLLRLMAHRCYFFINCDMHWNIMDFSLVSISLIDFVGEKVMQSEQGGNSNPAFLRMLRLLKLARILRALRSFRFSKSLAELVESFAKSFISLFWGFVMLAFVLYLFALVILQALVEHLKERADLDPDTRRYIISKFGGFGATLVSLYMSVTGGEDWGPYYDILCAIGGSYGVVFILFTFIFLFALFNILTGSIVEKSMSSAKLDRAEIILSQRNASAEQRQEFAKIFKLINRNHNITMSLQELEEGLSNPIVLSCMASNGLEVKDIEFFFTTMGAFSRDSRNRTQQSEITAEQFIDGCMQIKGGATALDMQRQLFETRKLKQDVEQLQQAMLQTIQRRDGISMPKTPRDEDTNDTCWHL